MHCIVQNEAWFETSQLKLDVCFFLLQHLEEQDLTHLDEFYKLVNPSREADSGEEGEESEEKKR